MKATGIIRRIDDLGRIVVPKEIRQNFHLKEGDPLELFISDDMICFKPHSPISADDKILEIAIETLKNFLIPGAAFDIYGDFITGNPQLRKYESFVQENSHAKDNIYTKDKTLELFPVFSNGEIICFLLVATPTKLETATIRVIIKMISNAFKE